MMMYCDYTFHKISLAYMFFPLNSSLFITYSLPLLSLSLCFFVCICLAFLFFVCLRCHRRFHHYVAHLFHNNMFNVHCHRVPFGRLDCLLLTKQKERANHRTHLTWKLPPPHLRIGCCLSFIVLSNCSFLNTTNKRTRPPVNHKFTYQNEKSPRWEVRSS